jgi:hypothetical protein
MGLEREGRRDPVRRHESLRQGHDPGPLRYPLPVQLGQRLGKPLRRGGEKHQIGAMELVLATAERTHLQLARQGDAGQITRVFAALHQRLCLLRGPAQERRSHPRTHEEQRNGCSE